MSKNQFIHKTSDVIFSQAALIKEVGQFQLIHDFLTDDYFITNLLTGQTSFRFDSEKMEKLLILDRNDFAQRCIQRAGNNLQRIA